jgi:hypothetical protein
LSNWIKIYESNQPWQAEIVKAMLEENEITAIVMNQRDSSYQAFGSASVMVQATDQHTAAALLLTLNLGNDPTA